MVYTDDQKKAHLQEISEMLYQIALRDSRIPAIVPTERYTPETALAVRAFQEANGLPVTGEIDTETWEKIAAVYHSMTDVPVPLLIFPTGQFLLQQGDAGELVYFVQVMLSLLARRYRNFPHIMPNGSYDTATADAVRKFQAIAQIPQTGTVDRSTWNHLASFVNQLHLTI